MTNSRRFFVLAYIGQADRRRSSENIDAQPITEDQDPSIRRDRIEQLIMEKFIRRSVARRPARKV